MSHEVLQPSKIEVNSSAENRSFRHRNPREIEECLEGKKLYGDEFSPDQVAAWFADEKEATTEIRGPDWQYKYHELNQFHGYDRLPARRFSNVLSLGGGDGSELLPLIDTLDRVTILESSEHLRPAIKAQYVLPETDGSIPFPENTFDLITCLSVLHHIPNVSRVIREIYRCADTGGFVLLREPTISMGDWRKPREGLSKHERGIPLHLMRQLIHDVGFNVISETRFCFAPIMYLNRKLKRNFYGSRFMLRLDSMLCKLPIWNGKYHAKTALEKFRPSGVFYVLTK
jgi:SAM-dependent methyltransferase